MFAELYLTLTDARRRRLVATLHTAESDAGVSLPAAVAGASDDADAVMAEFSEDHLPFLERAGFVDWDAGRARVARGPRFDELEPFLAVGERFDDQPAVDWPS